MNIKKKKLIRTEERGTKCRRKDRKGRTKERKRKISHVTSKPYSVFGCRGSLVTLDLKELKSGLMLRRGEGFRRSKFLLILYTNVSLYGLDFCLYTAIWKLVHISFVRDGDFTLTFFNSIYSSFFFLLLPSFY